MNNSTPSPAVGKTLALPDHTFGGGGPPSGLTRYTPRLATTRYTPHVGRKQEAKDLARRRATLSKYAR